MSDCHPIFIDGPLKGKDIAVPAGDIRYGYTVVTPHPVTVLPWPPDATFLAPELPTVTYRFHRFSLLGHIIMVGSIDPHPPQDDLWDLLASDQAKAAVREAP